MTEARTIPDWARPPKKATKPGFLILRVVSVGLLLVSGLIRYPVAYLILVLVLLTLYLVLYLSVIEFSRRRVRRGEGLVARTSRESLRAWGWRPDAAGSDLVSGRLVLAGDVLSWTPSFPLSPQFPGVRRPLTEVAFHEYTKLKRTHRQPGYLRIVFRDGSEWQFLAADYHLFQSLYPLPEPHLIEPPR